MDVTAFPDDLVQTQAARSAAHEELAVPSPHGATCCPCRFGCDDTPTGRPARGVGGALRTASTGFRAQGVVRVA